MQAADECGWREYPTAAYMRVSVSNLEYYAYADMAERVLMSNMPEIDKAAARVLSGFQQEQMSGWIWDLYFRGISA